MTRTAVLVVLVLLAGCGRTEPYPPAPKVGGVIIVAVPDAGACPIDWNTQATATLNITADDEYRLYVDGLLIDEVPRLWSAPQQYQVPVYRHPSRRTVIAIEGTNRFNIDGLDRGVIVNLSAENGTLLGTDASWRLATTVDSSWQYPWNDSPAFRAPTVIGPHGIPPWSSVLGTSKASWLWSYTPSGSAASKPVVETIWLRRVFYLRLDGGVSDVPLPCP